MFLAGGYVAAENDPTRPWEPALLGGFSWSAVVSLCGLVALVLDRVESFSPAFGPIAVSASEVTGMRYVACWRRRRSQTANMASKIIKHIPRTIPIMVYVGNGLR